MQIDMSAFEEPVTVTVTITPANPNARSLDPIAELRNNPVVQIGYQRKEKMNSKSAFMVISKKHLNWLKLLLEELKWSPIAAERAVLIQQCPVKRGIGRGARGQMWEEFIGELVQDKSLTHNDYSEGQLRHLPVLIAELARVSFRFKGAGTLSFIDTDTGVELL